MPLLYTCVACNSSVLADHADVVGNFEAATQQVLDRTDSNKPCRHTFNVKQYKYLVLTKGGFTFLAIADQDYPLRICFAFLEKVSERFQSGTLPQRAMTAKPYELRRDFSPVLSSLLVQYNKSQEVDSMANLHSEVDEVRGVMAKNIEKVMEKGEKLSRLEQRTAELDANASQFRRTGVQLQRRMWWRNQKMKIVLVGTVTVILTVIILIICWQKGVFKKKKY